MKTSLKDFEEIETKEDFLSFVYELSNNYRNDPKSWESIDIGVFLDALAAWVEDMEGFYLNQGLEIPETPDWKMIANMLIAAKMYE